MESTYTEAELRNFFEWQLEQMNPMMHRKNKDCWQVNTVDGLMASPVAVRGAIEAMDRAERRIKAAKEAGYPIDQIAPWEDPNWNGQQVKFVTGGQ